MQPIPMRAVARTDGTQEMEGEDVPGIVVSIALMFSLGERETW